MTDIKALDSAVAVDDDLILGMKANKSEMQIYTRSNLCKDAKFGGAVNYAYFDANGQLKLMGEATHFLDEMNDLIGKNLTSPSSKIVLNLPNNSVTYKYTIVPADDYQTMTIQRNHDAKLTANILPHIHWEQANQFYNVAGNRGFPNFILQYRWQVQGQAKTTAWTNLKITANTWTWVSGTLNQISSFEAITPPAGSGLSDMIELRLTRDYTNSLGKYSDAETGQINVELKALDVHKECDSLGSASELIK